MPTTPTRFRSLKPLDPAHARSIANRRARRARAHLEILSARGKPVSASPAEVGVTVRLILTALRRQGLFDDLSVDDRERVEAGARAYAERKMDAIDWVRFLHRLKEIQLAPAAARP
jgi:tRNA A37 N6-isopentenylltransferase MiaA